MASGLGLVALLASVALALHAQRIKTYRVGLDPETVRSALREDRTTATLVPALAAAYNDAVDANFEAVQASSRALDRAHRLLLPAWLLLAAPLLIHLWSGTQP